MLGIDRSGRPGVETSLDILALRNNTILPTTPAAARWLEAFKAVGYDVSGGPLIDRSLAEYSAGPVSSILGPDGTTRLLLGWEIRNHPNVEYIRADVTQITHDDSGKATGVNSIVHGSNETTWWRANTAVVVAGGVFNTFSLLIDSGIGPSKALETRQISDPWIVDETVGTGVGDELSVVVGYVEVEPQDRLGPNPSVTSSMAADASITMWSHGVETWLLFGNSPAAFLFDPELPIILRPVSKFLQWLFGNISFMAIGVPTGPVIQLEAVASSTTNPIGIVMDDSQVEVTPRMKHIVDEAVPALRKGFDMQEMVSGFSLARDLYRFLSFLGLFDGLKPNLVSPYNLESAISDESRGLDIYATYYHFYGGCSSAIDGWYRIFGTSNLFVSDASVFQDLAPGGSASQTMYEGARVAIKAHEIMTTSGN